MIKVVSNQEQTATGPLPITFNSDGTPLDDYKLYGTAEGAGVETENHFPYAEAGEYAFGARARVVSDGKGEFCIIGKITTNLETPVIPLTKPFTFPSVEDDERDTFFLGNPIQATNMNIRFYDENGALITYYTFNSQWHLVYNYPSLSGKTAYGIGFGSNSSASYSLDAYYVYPMFAKDQSITEYIPYGYKLPMTVEGGEKSATTPIFIGDSKLGEEEYVDYESGKVWKQFEISGLSEPICGIGEYKDTLDLSTGTVSRYIKKLVLTGTENWLSAGTNLYFRTSIGAVNTVLNSYDLFCTHFVTASIASTTAEIGAAVYNSASSNAATLNIRPSGIMSANTFKQFLANEYANGTPVTVWYVLVAPSTETITVPTGFTGTIEGYMSQSGIPTQESPIYPTANGEKQSDNTYSVLTLQPTDPPVALPELSTYKGENTLSCSEALGDESQITYVGPKEETIVKIMRTEDDGQGNVTEHVLYEEGS